MLERSINYLLRCWLLGCITFPLMCTMVAAEPDKNIQPWLQWLGVTSAVKQVDRIIAQEVKLLLGQQIVTDEQSQQLQKWLLTYSDSGHVADQVASYVSQHVPNSSVALTEVLKSPLAIRVRNFDVALEMEGAFDKYTSFNLKRSFNPVSEKRLELMRRLDTVQRTSEIAALIQTELSLTTKKLAEKILGIKDQEGDPQWTMLQRQQRERYMGEVVIKLHLFSYRFMKDKELQDYIQLMESNHVQSLFNVIVQGVQQSLEKARVNALK